MPNIYLKAKAIYCQGHLVICNIPASNDSWEDLSLGETRVPNTERDLDLSF